MGGGELLFVNIGWTPHKILLYLPQTTIIMLYISTLSFISIFSILGYLKYRKKITHLQTQIDKLQTVVDSSPHIFNNEMKLQFKSLMVEVEKLDRELNGKLDKRSKALYNQIEIKQRENIKNLKEILTNWENSEDFKMMLNNIRNKEINYKNGFTY